MSKYLDENGLTYLWSKIKGRFVEQVSGKGLSTNDYTTAEKNKLASLSNYTHPSYTPRANGLYKITVDDKGHVSDAIEVAKSDITDLGIPAQDTTYSDATHTAHGLMSSADKQKLDGFLSANSYALKTDLTGLYKYKGSIASSSLPTTGQVVGDTYNLTDASKYGPAVTNVAWTGEDWDALGGLFVINSLSNDDIDSICK